MYTYITHPILSQLDLSIKQRSNAGFTALVLGTIGGIVQVASNRGSWGRLGQCYGVWVVSKMFLNVTKGEGRILFIVTPCRVLLTIF